ncbi:MAG: diguanylate cyclase [Mariprofundaceae bacterium]
MNVANAEPPITVLLIDDQRTVVSAIEKMLAMHLDIDFHACNDGREAVQTACRIRPSVILQDITLPHIDGFALLSCYRKNPATRDIPVLMLSAEDKAEAKAQAFLAGADDYMVKPPHPIELAARIRHHSRAYFDHVEREKLLRKLHEQQALLQKANQQLQHLATTDALTQIANRRSFDKGFLHQWRLSVRNKTPFSVAIIDIDNFKPYNDYYGHQQGDLCLQQVANTLADSVQRPSDMIARYGGEEFAVICPDTPLEGAGKIAENMRAAIEALHIPHAQAEALNCVTISIGVASNLPGHTSAKDTPEQLLKIADNALYRSKENGRNRVTLAETK